MAAASPRNQHLPVREGPSVYRGAGQFAGLWRPRWSQQRYLVHYRVYRLTTYRWCRTPAIARFILVGIVADEALDVEARCSDSGTQKLPLRQVTPVQEREHCDGWMKPRCSTSIWIADAPALATPSQKHKTMPLGQHLTATMLGEFDSPGTGNDSAMINRIVLDQFTVFGAGPHSIFKHLA